MKLSLLALSGADLIVPSVTLVVIIVTIFLLVIFRRVIKAKGKVRSFYTEMEGSKDRAEKSDKISSFLQYCYIQGFGDNGKRICPICGNRYSVAETITDNNGDESREFVDKKCPCCSVKFYHRRDGGYDIERDVEIDKKYKNRYSLLTKYIDTYGSTPKDKTWDHSFFD